MNTIISIIALGAIGYIAYLLIPNFFINLFARLKRGGKIILPTASNDTAIVRSLATPTAPPSQINDRLLFAFLYERAWKSSPQFRDKKWNALIFPTIKNPGLWSYVSVQTEVQMKLRDYVMEEAARLKKDFQKTLPVEIATEKEKE